MREVKDDWGSERCSLNESYMSYVLSAQFPNLAAGTCKMMETSEGKLLELRSGEANEALFCGEPAEEPKSFT